MLTRVPVVWSLCLGLSAWGQSCMPTYSSFPPNTECFGSCSLAGPAPANCTICKDITYSVTFPDQYGATRNLSAFGAYNQYYLGCVGRTNNVYDPQRVECWPTFYAPVVSNGYYSVTAYDNTVNVTRIFCGVTLFNFSAACPSSPPGGPRIQTVSHQCPGPCPKTCGYPYCPYARAGAVDYCTYPSKGCPTGYHPGNPAGGNENAGCCCSDTSPVLINLDGNDFELTSPEDGVLFPIEGGAESIQIAWTVPGGNQGWLALDRNGNGRIDDGTELFGNHTPQPVSQEPNGFLALAVYDSAEHGGNGDGAISAADTIYGQLRLWIDRNHDGVSQPTELTTLSQSGVTEISLHYQARHRRDQYGNVFRYRAKVEDAPGAKVGRWAWDVFLAPAGAKKSP